MQATRVGRVAGRRVLAGGISAHRGAPVTRVDGPAPSSYGARPRCTRESPAMPTTLDPALNAALADSRAWPFEEARRLLARLERTPGGQDKTVIFETGYGPSGLPHIGTFGEVARTSMVRHAFEVLTEGKRKTRLLCFSDDMDGLRKVPDNVPNKEMLRAYLDKPLSRPRSFYQRISKFCRPQQRAAQEIPRPVRL